VQRTALSLAHPAQGTLSLGERDLSRLPADFMDSLQAKLSERIPGASLALSDTPRPIAGGVVLTYGERGEIEENGGIDALLSEKHDLLADAAAKVLFDEG